MTKQQSSPQEVLAQVHLFSGLSHRQLNRLTKMAREVTHEPGKSVADEGHGAAAFHVVLDGSADVLVHGEHRRRIGPGDYFGEMSLIDGLPRSATVQVSGDAPMRTLAIFRTDFNQLLEDDPTFARTLLVTLCTRLRAAEAGS
jgi:CRP-like cAMP-binding protein